MASDNSSIPKRLGRVVGKLIGRSKGSSIASPEDPSPMELLKALSAVMAMEGVDADQVPGAYGPFGLCATNPVPCSGISGATAYLKALRTETGRPVSAVRRGSRGTPVTPNPIDAYEVTADDGRSATTIFISPYNKRNSNYYPQGYYFPGGQPAPSAPSGAPARDAAEAAPPQSARAASSSTPLQVAIQKPAKSPSLGDAIAQQNARLDAETRDSVADAVSKANAAADSPGERAAAPPTPQFAPGDEESPIAKEFKVAEAVAGTMKLVLEVPVNVYGFAYDDLPLNHELAALIGFVTSCCDVFAQSFGGQQGGNGAINGALRSFQLVVSEPKPKQLLDMAFVLYDRPTEAFKHGLKCGTDYANGVLQNRQSISHSAMMDLLLTNYPQYCTKLHDPD